MKRGGGYNPNNKQRKMTEARSYRDEAEYYHREVIPWKEGEDKQLWERIAQTRIEEAERLEAQVYEILTDKEKMNR